MIYLFAGDDVKKKVAGYEQFIKSIPKEIELLSISRNNFSSVQVESFYSGGSLFSLKSALIFKGVLEYEETRDFVIDKLNQMEKSDSYFVFLEGKLVKPILDAFKKAKAQINIFELPKEKKEKYDNFLVANAFSRKDKLNMWICFREAMDRGVGMEEIIGVLFWKIKDMLIKKNFQKFSESQLKDYATRLSYLLPEARKEGRDAEASFEQFLLKVF